MITQDTLAILLLTTKFALPKDSEFNPFKLSEWNKLAQKIHTSEIKFPSSLFSVTETQLQSSLNLPKCDYERIIKLLSFSGQAALSLEDLKRKGIWVISRADSEYPQKIKNRLKSNAPAIFFCAGDKYLLNQPGVAMVGSRQIDKDDEKYARQIGSFCAENGKIIISGGAKGIDTLSVNSALENNEFAIAILPGGLNQFIKKKEYREKLESDKMTAISAYLPGAGFSVGAAMGRNKLIYSLSNYTFVIKSGINKGGTWAGAKEAINKKWVPVFVRPGFEGNDALIKLGGIAIEEKALVDKNTLQDWIDAQASKWKENSVLKQDQYKQNSLLS